ncbi:ATP-grasp domain-containing protein [Ekhidna sp.]
MKTKYAFLVTGCGGDLGQSIGKILNELDLVGSLYGMDISDRNAAQFIFENFTVGLPCNNPNYLKSLKEFIASNDIDFVIPASEQELRYFFENDITQNIGSAQLVTASTKALEVGYDKLNTAIFLKENSLPFPETKLLSETNSIEFPIILKSRSGSGSSQVHIIKDKESFDFYSKRNPDFIAQEYLEGDGGEYTCGLYRSSNREVRTLIFKRELTAGGYSNYGEVVENQTIEKLLHDISTSLNFFGSINVQLRLTKKGAVVFEINPRFSSTVLFRHMLGFKDLEWSIEDALGMEISPYTNKSVGKKFYKGFSEFIS